MGLDAYVFLSKAHLPFDADALGAELDPETGEYFLDDDVFFRRYSFDARTTCHKRIGNIALVAQLREEARRVLDENSVVRSKVIYSGSHCGDTLKSDLFQDLQRELVVLSSGQPSSAMLEFIRDMGDLINAATVEGNPIVF